MDFWQKAQSFAEEALKKSQELTQGISSVNLSDVVSEASKRSKELADEASKKSKEFAAEALKRADQITAQLPPAMVNLVDSAQNVNTVAPPSAADLEKFGVTDDLREFMKGITINTFQYFPLEDDAEMSDIPAVSNVRQDLTGWQEKHAKLVLSTVKEISKLRYQLCPRVMKERKFWRIYFILVNNHVAPYEKRFMEDVKVNAEKVDSAEVKESSPGGTSEKTVPKQQNNNSKSTASDQDLDVFLLGDLEDSDGGPDDGEDDDGDDGFEDDFDKL